MKTYGPISVDLRKKRREEKYKNLPPPSLSIHVVIPLFVCPFFIFIFFLLLLLFGYIAYITLFESVSAPNFFYFFSIQFILIELNSNHFLTFEIFVKISSLKSLATNHPEIRKIFRLSQNSTKHFWVTRFRETNLTMEFVSSSEI